MPTGHVVIVSGPPGAGKTTVSCLLAEHSPSERAVHLRSDDFYRHIVKGLIPPWGPDAQSQNQNQVVVEAVAAATERLALGGYEVVVDGVFGPWLLEPWLSLASRGVDVHYAVLRPDEATTTLRAVSRKAPGALIDPAVIRAMWRQFAAIGAYEEHVLVTSAHTAAESALEVRRLLSTQALKLGPR